MSTYTVTDAGVIAADWFTVGCEVVYTPGESLVQQSGTTSNGITCSAYTVTLPTYTYNGVTYTLEVTNTNTEDDPGIAVAVTDSSGNAGCIAASGS